MSDADKSLEILLQKQNNSVHLRKENSLHSGTRILAVCTFGILRTRFSQFLAPYIAPNKADVFVMTACVATSYLYIANETRDSQPGARRSVLCYSRTFTVLLCHSACWKLLPDVRNDVLDSSHRRELLLGFTKYVKQRTKVV